MAPQYLGLNTTSAAAIVRATVNSTAKPSQLPDSPSKIGLQVGLGIGLGVIGFFMFVVYFLGFCIWYCNGKEREYASRHRRRQYHPYGSLGTCAPIRSAPTRSAPTKSAPTRPAPTYARTMSSASTTRTLVSDHMYGLGARLPPPPRATRAPTRGRRSEPPVGTGPHRIMADFGSDN